MDVIEKEEKCAQNVAEYFAHKNVFVTGGTGFLGTVLIEALLRTSPHIGNIYVLIRDKNGFEANSRINKLLSKALFAEHSEEALKKVKPIIGELSEPNFAIKDDVLKELTSTVNIIIHGAATIKFNSYLGTAIKINLIGTLRTVEFAKKLKNLSSYIYLSTAFCNSNYNKTGVIMETIYESHYDPYEIIKLCNDQAPLPENGTPELMEYLKGHPNTYTFTKQLAENLIKLEMAGYPSGIVRPSVVYGTYRDPVKGWVGSANNGHLGFLVGFSKGLFRTMSGNPEAILDIIPCDYVSNSTLALCWYVGTHKPEQTEVIHCTSGEINPISNQNLCDMYNNGIKEHPSDYILWRPHCKIRNSYRYLVFVYLFHYIPSLFLYIPEAVLPVKKPKNSILEYVQVFDKGTKAFHFFMSQNFRYSMKKSLHILSLMDPKDAEKYCYDARNYDWQEFINTCLKGLRYYFFKESKESTLWHKVIWNISEVVNVLGFVFGFLIIYLLCSTFTNAFVAATIALLFFSFILWL